MIKSYINKYNKISLEYIVDGKRIRRSTGLKNSVDNQNLVNNELIPQLQQKITTGTVYKKQLKTFRYYGNIFISYKEKTIRTFLDRLPYYERVINYFNDINVDDITRLDIKQYLNNLEMKSRSKTIYKSIICEVLELAVDDNILSFNPAVNIKLPPEVKGNIDYFSKEDVLKILDVAKGIIRPYLLIAFNTGMRPEEILGLQAEDIKDGYIEIKRVRTKKRIDYPKTKNSFRKVPYPSFIHSDILELQSVKSLFLFGDIDDAGRLRHQWRKVIKDSRVEYKKLYNTRHTYATLMLKEKIVSINELAGLLGHSSPKVTFTHYASVIDTDLIDIDKNFSLYWQDVGNVVKVKA